MAGLESCGAEAVSMPRGEECTHTRSTYPLGIVAAPIRSQCVFPPTDCEIMDLRSQPIVKVAPIVVSTNNIDRVSVYDGRMVTTNLLGSAIFLIVNESSMLIK